MQYKRTIRADGVDAETGTIQMTLATEGEASDGHILSIAGGDIPDQMPLLSSHWNDPESTLGSVVEPRKDLKSDPARLRAVGQIETGGEGQAQEKRNDLLHMAAQGHINAVSIRWDSAPDDAVRRVNLPSDHKFFVDESEEPMGSPRRWGMFFKKWRALEGSIVAIGADPGALIGRAEELEAAGASEERVAFCRAMAADAEMKTAEAAGASEERLHQYACELASQRRVQLEKSLEGLRAMVDSASDAGAEPADILNAVSDVSTEALRAVEIDGVQVFLPGPAAEYFAALEEDARAEGTPAVADPGGIVEPVPDPPAPESAETFDPSAVVATFREVLDERDANLRGSFADMLAEATGKVT